MGFAGPLFTDSGDFQAFSLGFGKEHNIAKIGNIFQQELACSGEENSGESESLYSEEPSGIYKLNYRRSYGEKSRTSCERSGGIAR